VRFGTYAGAPLIWRILTINDTQALLLADEILTAGSYRSNWQAADAHNYLASDARAWLTASTAAILSLDLSELTVSNADGDLLYLLSAEEVVHYLQKAAARKAVPHSQALTTVGYSNESLYTAYGYGSWWLRTTGNSEPNLIDPYGEPQTDHPAYAFVGIRPALTLDLTKPKLVSSQDHYFDIQRR
jgi:hypothetical protein